MGSKHLKDKAIHHVSKSTRYEFSVRYRRAIEKTTTIFYEESWRIKTEGPITADGTYNGGFATRISHYRKPFA